MSDCEELVGSITGDDGTEMIVGALRSRRSITGQEMAGQAANGVKLPFVLLDQLLDHKISQVYDHQGLLKTPNTQQGDHNP